MSWSDVSPHLQSGAVLYADGPAVTDCQRLDDPSTAQFYVAILFVCFQSASLHWLFIC